MKRVSSRILGILAVAALVWVVSDRANAQSALDSNTDTFAGSIDLDPLFKTAVQADGRLRSFESHAKTYMGYIAGPRAIHGHSNGFTYLDLMFRPQAYANQDIIYVKHKGVREQILKALADHPELTPPRREMIEKSGLFAKEFFKWPTVNALLDRLGQDLIRTSKQVDAIGGALNVSDPRVLERELRLIAPTSGKVDEPWSPMSRMAIASTPQDDAHASAPTPEIAGLDRESQLKLAGAWTRLEAGWRAQNAAEVNQAVAELAATLPQIAPALYPTPGRLAMESWYFRYKSMTWVWLFYLASVIPLLMSVIYRWNRARTIGMALFVLAFAAHTASVGVRWYISGRWPNSNMFEALTTSAWLGVVAALILERLTRKTPFRNLFALGSAVMAMTALMAAYFLPAQLDSSINNKMAALNDIWLYIHTNMIIWSYAIIGLACIPALLLLGHRWVRAWRSHAISKLRLSILPIAVIVLNYTAYKVLMHAIAPVEYGLAGKALVGTIGALWGSLMIVLLEAMAARARRQAGGATERAASGGASALFGGGSAFLRQEKPTANQVFDGATMVLVELAFIMLWTGLVMGAIWADHSWGRPWGWDPKEVFALNTFIVFMVLIHIRLKVKDKSFWTAVIAVVGFEVMMFNWIVVNFVISGLHSYA